MDTNGKCKRKHVLYDIQCCADTWQEQGLSKLKKQLTGNQAMFVAMA